MGFGKCCICGERTSDRNILLNGERYHTSCFNKLRENKTDFDSKIEDLKDRIRNNKQEISNILHSRSLFQKLFGSLPDGVENLRKKNTGLKIDLEGFLKKKRKIREKRDEKLSDIYDYWPERPPDWYTRSQIMRSGHTRCSNCGRKGTRNFPLHVHHKIPISKGGNHSFVNLEVLCFKCHEKEHKYSFNSGKQKEGNSNFRSKLNYVEEAQRKNVFLSFKYRRYEGGRDKHYVKVKSIFNRNNSTYFNGYCVLNNAERNFRVDKIYHAEIKRIQPREKLPAEYIDEAMKKGKILHFHYTKSNGDKSIRSLKPHGYTTFKGVKVFGGHDYLTGEKRNFSPHRMSKIQILDKPQKCRVITGSA